MQIAGGSLSTWLLAVSEKLAGGIGVRIACFVNVHARNELSGFINLYNVVVSWIVAC